MMTEPSPLSFTHIYRPATVAGRPPLLLLHGTGGDENDLIGLGQSLASGAALLSPRGKVLDHGMPRFFSRLAEGVFDLNEVRRGAHELADFVMAARDRYGLPAPLAVGYSNGANIAAAVLTQRPGTLAGAILLRPMAILDEPASGLETVAVLMLSGASDPIVPSQSALALAEGLKAAGATVEHRVVQAGHGITQEDVVFAKSWLEAPRE